jgi:asparagine synthase (glutamine-hydrolysing)
MTFSSLTAKDRVGLMSARLRDRTLSNGRPEAFGRSLVATSGMHPVERLLDLELNGFLPDLNLNYTDKMAMRTGVEVRVPLVDTRVVEFAAKLPISDRIDLRTTKKILRASQRNRLPNSVLNRPKQGFGVPVRSWLSGPARPVLEELTAPSVLNGRGLFDSAAVARLKDGFLGGRVDAATNLLSIMGIELWCRALDAAPTAGGREVLQPGLG